VHAFLIEEGGELALVDTLFESDARLVLEAIRGLGRSVTDLKRIAITHAHRSHLGGLAALKRASGATVFAQFLGSLYNGSRVKADVSGISSLDCANFEHLMNVMRLCKMGGQEPHQYFKNGNAIFGSSLPATPDRRRKPSINSAAGRFLNRGRVR